MIFPRLGYLCSSFSKLQHLPCPRWQCGLNMICFQQMLLRDVWLLITAYRISAKSDSWPGDQSVLTTHTWNKVWLNVGTTKWKQCKVSVKTCFHLVSFIYLSAPTLFLLLFDFWCLTSALSSLASILFILCVLYFIFILSSIFYPFSDLYFIHPGALHSIDLCYRANLTKTKKKQPGELIFHHLLGIGITALCDITSFSDFHFWKEDKNKAFGQLHL